MNSSTSLSSSSRSSSVTSISSSDSTAPSIQSLTECLHRIHASKDFQSDLLLEALGMVELLKQNQLSEMPFSVKQRALKLLESNQQMAVPQNAEVAFLFGRCFNLSMNAKIMVQCNYADPNIATRVLTDLEVIASSLRAKLNDRELQSFALLSLWSFTNVRSGQKKWKPSWDHLRHSRSKIFGHQTINHKIGWRIEDQK